MTDITVSDIYAHLVAFERGDLPPRNDLDKMGQGLAALLRVPVYPQPDREYVHSDAFGIMYTPDAHTLPWAEDGQVQTPVFTVYVRFSWISPYVMVDWKGNLDGTQWLTMSDDELPGPLRKVSEKIHGFLAREGNQVISGTILDEIIPGRTSELDEMDLTVREALFSAID